MRLSAARVFLGAALFVGAAHPAYAETSPDSAVVRVTLTNDGCVASPASGIAGPVTLLVTDTTGDQVTEVELVGNGLIVGKKKTSSQARRGNYR